MNSLLDNQKIKKRKHFAPVVSSKPSRVLSRQDSIKRDDPPRRPGKFSGKAAYRPAGIISFSEQNSKFIEKVRQNPVHVHQKKAVKEKRDSFRQEGRDSRFFSFAVPAIPVAAVFLFALGVFFSVSGQGFDWIGREVISAGKDQGGRYNMAIYAGINPAEDSKFSSGETIPLDLTEVFAWQSYKVKRGDSVSKIAAAFSVSMDAIIASNGITNARSLREGELLRIPNMDGIPYTIKAGDNLSGISQSMGVPLEVILDANDIQNDIINAGTTLFIPGARMNREDLKLALGELFIYPIRGARLSSPFGWRDDPFSGVRRHHAAVDLSAPQGTQVKAAMEGKVSAQSYDRTYGNYIILSHPGGFQSMYAHLNTVLVKKGEQVAQGAQIGTVGSTGYSTGPHLHFAIFKNSRAVNPLDYMNSQR
jgi:murein DD-endopeptidase MepM/ murein hydrolase activator NlpD